MFVMTLSGRRSWWFQIIWKQSFSGRHCSRYQGKKSMSGNVHVRLACRALLFLPNLCHKRAIFLAETLNKKSVHLFSDDVLITKSLF